MAQSRLTFESMAQKFLFLPYLWGILPLACFKFQFSAKLESPTTNIPSFYSITFLALTQQFFHGATTFLKFCAKWCQFIDKPDTAPSGVPQSPI